GSGGSFCTKSPTTSVSATSGCASSTATEDGSAERKGVRPQTGRQPQLEEMLAGRGSVNCRVEPVAVDPNGPGGSSVDENLYATLPTDDDEDVARGVVQPDPRVRARDDTLRPDGPDAAVGEL